MALKPFSGTLDETPPLKPFAGELDAPTQAAPAPIARPSGLVRRVVGDTAVDIGKGVIGVGEAAVGLGNLVSGGYVGKGLEAVGYKPAEAKAMLEEGYTPERVAANKEVGEAKGFLGTTAAMLRNPSTIAGAAVESAPLMVGGGAIARGGAALLGKAGSIAAPGLRGAAAAIPHTMAGRIGLAAAGEGAIGAGAAAENIRQQSDDRLLDAKGMLSAIGSGAGTAVLGAAGGKIAQKLGIADVDVALAGGNTLSAPKKAILRRVAEGMLSEGVFEELPQSAQEQMWSNYATGKPLTEGVAEAAAAGALAGGLMGGGFSAIARPDVQKPVQSQTPNATPDATAPDPFAGYTTAADPATTVAQPAAPDPLDGATINADLDARDAKAFDQEAITRGLDQQAENARVRGVMDGTIAPIARPPVKATPSEQTAANMRVQAQVMDATAKTVIKRAGAMALNMQADAVAQEAPLDRLARIAVANGLDPAEVLKANEPYDAQGESFADLPDEVLSTYAKTLLEDARGPAQANAGPAPQGPGLDVVGSTGDDPLLASDRPAEAGSSASQAVGVPAEVGGRPEASADDAAGAQAERVTAQQIKLPSTLATSENFPYGRGERAASLYIMLAKPNGAYRGVRDAGWETDPLREQMRAELEAGKHGGLRNGKSHHDGMMSSFEARYEELLRERYAAQVNSEAATAAQAPQATQPADNAPAPRPDTTEQSSAVPAQAAAPAAPESEPLPSAATSTPAAGPALESQSSEASSAPVAGVSAASREEGQRGVKGVQEGSAPVAAVGQDVADVPRHIASMNRSQRDSFQVDKAEASRSTPGNWKIVAEAATPNDLNPERAASQLAKFDEAVKELDGQFAGKSRGASSEKLVSAWTQQGQLRTAIAQSRAANPEMWAAYDARQAQVAALKVGDRVNTAFGGSGVITRKFGKNWRILDDDGIHSLQSPAGLTPAAEAAKPAAPATADAIQRKADEVMEIVREGGINLTRDQVVALIQEKGIEAADKTISGFRASRKKQADDIAKYEAAKAKLKPASAPAPQTQAPEQPKPQQDSQAVEALRQQLREVEAQILQKAPASLSAGGGNIEAAAKHRQVPTALKEKRKAIREQLRQAQAEQPAPSKGGNAGAIVAGMVDAAQASAAELRGRIDNVKYGPAGNGAETITFTLDGKPHVGELKGRNKDAVLAGNGAESDKGLAVRVFLDGDAKPAPSQQQADPPKSEKSEPKPAAQAASEPAAKIDDFGEKLEGARKFLPPSLKEALDDGQIASLPLSKVWPSDAHMEIEDPMTAAMAFTARNEIPAKPRQPRKVQAWVAQVKMFRALMDKFTTESMDRLLEIADEKGFASLRSEFFPRVQLLAQLPREQWGRVEKAGHYPNARRLKNEEELKRDGFVAELREGSRHYYDYFKVNPKTRERSERIVPWGPTSNLHDELFTPAPHSTVTIDGKTTTFDVPAIGPDEVVKVLELLGQAKPQKGGLTSRDFEVRSKYGSKTAFINRKGDAAYRRLKEFTGDDAVKQAQAYLADNVSALAEAWEGVKARDNVGKGDIRRAANEERKGENRRNGKDVTEAMFEAAFGFRGVQFGNWVKQGKGGKDRQGLLNDAYDGLLDLSDVLGIPSRAISLEGTLGLSLGAQGSGKHAATFHPDRLVINLTKTRGSGSLAHEWFHALDNYFARKRGGEVPFTGDNTAYRENNFITYKPEPMLRSTKGFGTKTKAEVARLHKVHPKANAYYPENWEPSPDHKQGVRPVVEKAFAELVAALNASPMAKRSADIDGVKVRGDVISTDGYWSRIIERGARSFENYVISKMAQRGWSNDFLVNIRSLDQWREIGKNEDRYPYLKPEEEAPITEAFDNLFETIEARQDGGNVVLESVEELTDADLTPAQRASFDRQSIDRTKLRADLSREQGERDADALGLRKAVDAVLGKLGVKVTYLRGNQGLPPDMLADLERKAKERGVTLRTAGLFHPVTKEVFVFTDVARTPQMAAFTASHEIAGHQGLRALLGDRLNAVLDLAYQNPTVKAVADHMYTSREMYKDVQSGKKTERQQRLLSIEEALADLAAAVRTKNFQRITEKHGVEVPKAMQSRLRAMIDNLVQRIKDLFRRKDVRFSDAQVLNLLENAWQAAQGSASGPAVLAPEFAAPVDAAPRKDEANRRGADAEVPADVAESLALGEQAFSKLDVPRQRMVLAAVGRVLQDLKVRQAVVEAIPVDVVNVLTRGQFSPKALFNKVPVLLDLLAINGNQSVAARVDSADATVALIARAAAEEPSVSLSDKVVLGDARSALRAGGRNHWQTIPYDESGRTLESVDNAGMDLSRTRVVDKDGQPLTVYHGTPGTMNNKPLTKFTKQSRGGLGGTIGFWFATTREAAQVFAKERFAGVKPQIVEAKLDIRNPKEYDGHLAFVRAANDRPGKTIEERLKSLRRVLTRAGHDGIVIRNSDTDNGGVRDDWVAFEPEQIGTQQSAIGTPASALESTEGGSLEGVDLSQTKVVGKDGKPLRVFHGTFGQFDTFDPDMLGSATGAPSAFGGFFFASNRDVAQSYASRSAKTLRTAPDRLKEVRSEIEKITSTSPERAIFDYARGNLADNPKIARLDALFDEMSELEDAIQGATDDYFADGSLDEDGRIVEAYLDLRNPLIHEQDGPVRTEAFSALIERAKKGGHDGVIIRNTEDDGSAGGTHDPETDVFVAFTPQQIVTQPGVLESTEDQTQSEAFRKWFGKSAVVDADGKPLVVYHGTAGNFDVFDSGKSTTASMHATAVLGHYFSVSPDVANGFVPVRWDLKVWPNTVSPKDGGNVMPVYLSIANPYEMSIAEFRAMVPEGRMPSGVKKAEELRARLEREGYDGIHIPGDPTLKDTMAGDEWSAETWIAFKPNQIKSATGNKGSFDPTSDSILESVEGFTLSDNPTLDEVRIPGEVRLDPIYKAGFKGVLQRLGQKFADVKPHLLATVPLNHLVDFAPKGVPAIGQYVDIQYQMQAFRNALYTKYDKVAQDLLKFSAEGKGVRGWFGMTVSQQGRDLFSLMHDSTIAGVDPTKDGYPDEKVTQFEALKARYEALPEEGQRLYRETRDAYKAQSDLLDETISNNFRRAMEITQTRAERAHKAKLQEINESGKSEDEKIKLRGQAANAYDDQVTALEKNTTSRLMALREMLESQRVQEPYFPLKRYGKHWVTVLDKGGTMVGFSKFQTTAEQEAFSKEMQAKGYTTRLKFEDGDSQVREMIDPEFAARVEEILQGSAVPDNVKDEVWQAYLERMPDMSMRKSFIHRMNVPGYHFDALKAFGSSQFHGSYQIARLKFGMELQETIELAKEQTKPLRQIKPKDAIDADKLIGEIEKRHAFVMNPKGGTAAQVVTTAAFIYSLGANPAHLFLNATQTVMLGVPVLGSRYGFKRTAAAMGRAVADFARGKGNLDKANLSADDRKAFQAFMDSGLIDKTQAHDLAGVGETGVEYSAVRQKVMNKIGWFFHQSERFNREVTAMAAYRLARADGRNHEAAVALAINHTYTIHFDYSAASRARFMQGDTAKALLVFRNYNVNMLYRLFRDINDSLRGESPQVKREARKQLGAMMGMYGLFAGTMGMPFYGLAMALAGLGDDDDDPVTAEQQFVNGTVEFLGPTAASLLLRGLPGTAFDIDLSERIGMPNLWFRSPQQEMEGRDSYYYWMEQLLGAGVGPVKGAIDGFNLIMEGQIQRGLERAMPAALRNPMQAIRQAQEGGVTSLDGDLIKETTGGDYIAKAMGFQPLSVSEQYDANSNLKNADRRLSNRREKLLNQYFLAIQMGDDTAEVMADVQAFNVKNPDYAITRDTFRRSARLRNRNKLLSENGIVMTRRMRRLQERMNSGEDSADE